MKPQVRPANPRFSSGPCTKRPSWTSDNLKDACLGPSHRPVVGKAKLAEVMPRSLTILPIPDD